MISNKTKIIATVGPACQRTSVLKRMVSAGTNVFRVNMSHGSDKEKQEIIQKLKNIVMPNGEKPCIMVDLAGPKIRVRSAPEGFVVKKGDTIEISSGGKTTQKTVIVSSKIRFSKVKKGASIKINDGFANNTAFHTHIIVFI